MKHLNKSIFCLLLFLSVFAFAQKKKATSGKEAVPVTNTSNQASAINLDLLKNMKARSIGPAAMSGRVTAVDAVWANPDIIYAGAASGGVWKTENGGMTWKSVFDENPIINIGAIAIQQSNPSVVWVGTGEGNPRNTVNLGAGIYKTMDGGKTWKCMGLEKTSNIHRVIIDPTNPNIVYAGAIGNPFAAHPERGVFKTTDGGQTWEKILFTNENSGVGDMVIDPTNPNKIFVNMWEHHRTPYDFKSGGAGSGFYLTFDGGKNWKKLSKDDGIPEGDLGRIGIAVAASDPNVVYALIESKKNALYKSEDGGLKWAKVNEDESVVNNRPFYFCDIAVDPQNENRIYNVYQMISMSEDGGKSFKIIVPYSGVHPDHHAFWIHPKDPSFIINGNDGGVAISRDRGRKWTFAESIPVGQFYHVNTDNDIPYNIYGGLQDNGSWRGPAYTWMTGGIRNQYWEAVLFGDGFDVMPDLDDNRYGFAMSQGGSLARYDAKTGDAQFIKPTHPDKNMRLRFNWNSGIAQDPHNKSGIYYGSQFLHKSTDKGTNWEIISPDLTTNNKEQQKASDNSGGLSIDITSAENHNTILSIAPSPLQKDVVWVGTDDGNVQVTKDGGKTWTNVAPNMPNLPKESWIPQIKASTYHPEVAFVVANNYRNGGGFVPYIYRTKDYGQTWERMVDENKVKGYALCVLQDAVEPNLIFVGTEQGLWVSFDNGATFGQWKHGFPPVSTMDLTIQERESDLVIATFGRAMYVLDNIQPLRKLAATKGQDLTKKLAAFKSADAYLVNEKDAPGIMFGGDELYEGENRKIGGIIKFFVNPPKKEKKADDKAAVKDSIPSIKYDTVYAKIYTNKGLLIRTLQQKIDSVGMQQIVWDLTEKGIRMPGSKKDKSKKNPEEPAGQRVLPDTYKIVLSFGDQKDSTSITVHSDPRVAFNEKNELEKRALYERMMKTASKLTTAIDQLDDAKDATDLLLNQIKDSNEKALQDLTKATKAMQDTIKVKRELVLGKKMERQGYGRPYQLTPNGKINEARNYLQSKSVMTKAETILVESVEELSQVALGKINTFFENQWKNYQKQVEAAPLKLIKTYEAVK